MNDRSLRAIAGEIKRSWPEPYFAAASSIKAMRGLEKVTDKYGTETGEDVVASFLLNSWAWSGPTAWRIKAELEGMIK